MLDLDHDDIVKYKLHILAFRDLNKAGWLDPTTAKKFVEMLEGFLSRHIPDELHTKVYDFIEGN